MQHGERWCYHENDDRDHDNDLLHWLDKVFLSLLILLATTTLKRWKRHSLCARRNIDDHDKSLVISYFATYFALGKKDNNDLEMMMGDVMTRHKIYSCKKTLPAEPDTEIQKSEYTPAVSKSSREITFFSRGPSGNRQWTQTLEKNEHSIKKPGWRWYDDGNRLPIRFTVFSF